MPHATSLKDPSNSFWVASSHHNQVDVMLRWSEQLLQLDSAYEFSCALKVLKEQVVSLQVCIFCTDCHLLLLRDFKSDSVARNVNNFWFFANGLLEVYLSGNSTLVNYLEARLFDGFLNLIGFSFEIQNWWCLVAFGEAIFTLWLVEINAHDRRCVQEYEVDLIWVGFLDRFQLVKLCEAVANLLDLFGLDFWSSKVRMSTI